MKKYLIKVRRRKGMIDLSAIGHEEQMLYAVAHKDNWLKEKFQEAVIVGDYTAAETPLPNWRPQVERVSVWGIISRELLALRP